MFNYNKSYKRASLYTYIGLYMISHPQLDEINGDANPQTAGTSILPGIALMCSQFNRVS